jgi:hypothetical protein
MRLVLAEAAILLAFGLAIGEGLTLWAADRQFAPVRSEGQRPGHPDRRRGARNQLRPRAPRRPDGADAGLWEE